MKHITFAVVLCLLLSLSGCVPSLHELYTEKDLVFQPGLLGEWVEAKQESKTTLVFTKVDDKSYKLVFASEKDTMSFAAHLVKLGDKLFLDIGADPSADCHTLALPVHMFFLVSQTEPTLRMRDFDDHWLDEFLKKNPGSLKHDIVDKDAVVTASTSELQSFVLQHVNTRSAFADPVDYVRKK
jgi:hypothetical protein